MDFGVVASTSEPHVLIVRGELDVSVAPTLAAAGRKVLDDGATDVVLDATALEFVDSAGLGCMVMLHKRAVEAGGALVLRHVNERLYRLLELVGLTKVFTVHQ